MKSGAKSLKTLSKDELIETIHRRDNVIQMLQEKLRLFSSQKYGARSEQRSKDPQADLFNEVEALQEVSDEALETAAPAEIETVTYTRQKTRGRKPLPASLPREEIEHDIPEADKICACGCQKRRIGSDTSERLEYIPAKLYVEHHIRHKYACPSCEDGVQVAQNPPALLPKSNAGPGLLAFVVTAKYQDALPLYRQEKIFTRHGLDLTRQTLANWIIKCSQALSPLIEQMEHAIAQVPVILMDETTVQVNKEPNKAASSGSYMWIRRGLSPPDEDNLRGRDITLYHYSPNRSGETASTLLAGYSGALMTDGYAGYYAVAKKNRLIHAQCWAHARRKYIEAEKQLPKGKKSPAITAILSEIGKLYGIEKQLKSLDADEKMLKRQQLAAPVLENLRKNLDKKLQNIVPKSALGEAIAYTLKHWAGLTRYLSNGHIPIDNNAAENGIRPFVIGRKNWLFCDTVNGAHASARLYSLMETAKANGLEPYHYLKHLFKELPKAQTESEVVNLLPWKIEALALTQ